MSSIDVDKNIEEENMYKEEKYPIDYGIGFHRERENEEKHLSQNNTPLEIASPVLLSSHHFDWNLEYQPIIQALRKTTTETSTDEKLGIYQKLSYLYSNFVHTATNYGKIIIGEVYLPDEQKTIPPAPVGGFMGGAKYVAQNIYFKFAVDNNNLLGSDEYAMKVAGHELNSMIELFNCDIPNLNFAMMSLIDYRGYRLIASSLVPIKGNATIVHGTADAGKTIHSSNGSVQEMMQIAGKKLNLKPHLVGSKRKPTLLCTTADLEIHAGIDGQFYAIDFSR